MVCHAALGPAAMGPMRSSSWALHQLAGPSARPYYGGYPHEPSGKLRRRLIQQPPLVTGAVATHLTMESKRYLSTILATCTVPWNDAYQFMEDPFREQVRQLRHGLTKHLYIFGTAGEGYAVSDQQFDRIARVFREETDFEDTHPMLGIISLSTSTIIERIERGLAMGFEAFQISLPSWGALTDREVDRFFAETCGRFPQASFLHYNLKRTKRMLAGADYARLAAAHPNLVAVKTGADDRDQLVDLLTHAPQLQFFFTEPFYALVRDEHECGLLISLASIHFERAKRYFAARGDELAALQAEIDVVRQRLFDAVGQAGHMDGVFDKLFTKLHLPEFPLRLLPPYTAGDEQVFARFRDALPEAWRRR